MLLFAARVSRLIFLKDQLTFPKIMRLEYLQYEMHRLTTVFRSLDAKLPSGSKEPLPSNSAPPSLVGQLSEFAMDVMGGAAPLAPDIEAATRELALTFFYSMRVVAAWLHREVGMHGSS